MQHIGFIMDGNRSWAKSRMLPSLEGHRRGYETVKKIIRLVKARGIPFVSIWALSDDNIVNRSKEEVTYLFELLTKGMREIAKEAKEEGNRIIVVGDRSLLPEKCLASIEYAETSTKDGKGITTIVAIAYGGQNEILQAIQKLGASGVDIKNLDLETLKDHMETAQFPPPDIIVRTGGHIRHSGYFLFQSPYSEYYFSEKYWPDFDENDLDDVIESFEKRERKFGK